MLLDCLNFHPTLYGFPKETRVIPSYFRKLPKYGDLDNDENFLRLWNDFRRTICFLSVNKGEPVPLPENWRDQSRSISSVLDGVLRYFAARDGKTRWCEKTPMHALHMRKLSELFEDARFIHIVRDGRDCAASFHRRWRYTPECTMYRWKNVVRFAREQGKLLGHRYLEMSYEDLTIEPKLKMQQVCDFLGVPYDDGILRISRERAPMRTLAETIVPNTEKWRKYFNENELSRLERIGGRTLAELGYATTQPDSDYDPPGFPIAYWTYKDNLRRGLANAFRMFRTRDPYHRRLMFVALKTAIGRKLKINDYISQS